MEISHLIISSKVKQLLYSLVISYSIFFCTYVYMLYIYIYTHTHTHTHTHTYIYNKHIFISPKLLLYLFSFRWLFLMLSIRSYSILMKKPNILMKTTRAVWWCMCAQLLQLCPALCRPMDCSLPGPFVHGISWWEYWSGLPCPPPGDLPNPRIETASLYH